MCTSVHIALTDVLLGNLLSRGLKSVLSVFLLCHFLLLRFVTVHVVYFIVIKSDFYLLATALGVTTRACNTKAPFSIQSPDNLHLYGLLISASSSFCHGLTCLPWSLPLCLARWLMFSFSSASFSDNGTCDKYKVFAALKVMMSALESQLHTMENKQTS